MNITSVDVQLSGEDVRSIINDFVKVPGLSIDKIEIENNLSVVGSYKAIVDIPFKVNAEIVDVHHNMIFVNISRIQLFKMGIFKFIRNMALKVALKETSEYGVFMDGKEIKVDLNRLLKKFPFISLELDSLKIENNLILVNTKHVSLDISKIGASEDTAEEENVEEEAEEEIDLDSIEKKYDSYSEGRKITNIKISKTIPDISEYILILPDIICLLYRLLRDSRVSKKDKAVIISAISYVALPVDIIPDSIPFIGKIDEISVVLFTLNKILKDIPIEVLIENWEGKNEIIITLRKTLEYLKTYTKVDCVENIYMVIEKIVAN